MFRHRLLFISLVIVSLTAAAVALARSVVKVSPKQRISTSFSAGDGKLCIYNYHENMSIETDYRRGDKYRQKGLGEIRHIFRSRSDGQEHSIDIELIELLDHIQDHFGIDCVELISGYRSPQFNRELKEKKISVAEESLHMEGLAADIHIDEVTEKTLSRYARSLGVGGVGYYPTFDFVHVDTGDVRRWDLSDRSDRLLMAMQNSDKWQVITDRNIYLPGETIHIEMTNIAQTSNSPDKKIRVEHFSRGKWKLVETLSIPTKAALASKEVWRTQWNFKEGIVYGKFRLVIPGQPGFPQQSVLSNEFYRKRQ